MEKNFKKQFLKGSASTSIGTIVSMSLHFVSLFFITRQLSVEYFGIYSLILATVYVFNTVGSFALEITIVKFLNDRSYELGEVVLPIILLKLCFTILVGIIFILLSDVILMLFDVKLIGLNYIILILFILGSFRDILYALFQGLKNFKYYVIINISNALFRLVFILVYYTLEKLTFQNLINIEIYSIIFSLIILSIKIPYSKLVVPALKLTTFISIIKFSFPLYINNLFYIVNTRLNIFIIGIMLSPVSIALFEIADKIPSALRKIYASFLVVYFPNITELLTRKAKSSAESLLNSSLLIIVLFLSFATLISYLFGGEIIITLFSDKYIEVKFAFFLLMLNLVIRSSATLFGNTILSAGHSSVPMYMNLLSSIVNLGTLYITLPMFGFVGAVISLLISNIVSKIGYLIYLNRLNIKVILTNPLLIITLLLGIIILHYLINYNSVFIDVFLLYLFIQLNYLLIPNLRKYLKSASLILNKT